MRFPRLNAKLMNRLCVLALLFAPILYLFGVQWTSLLGAHGEIVLADDVVISEEFDLNVEIDGNTYQRWYYVDGPSYFFNQFSYMDFLYLYPDGYYCNVTDLEWNYVSNMTVSLGNECFGFFDGGSGFVLTEISSASYASVVFSSDDGYLVSFEYWYSDTEGFNSYGFEVYPDSNTGGFIFDTNVGSGSGALGDFDISPNYSYLDFGSSISNSWFLNYVEDLDSFYSTFDSYRKAPLKAPKIVHTEGNPNPTPSDNSKYLFENFFPKDNWVTNMGRDVSAGSNPPYGFAPFGTLINYIDENMLHFHETDNSPGLFFYGYSYWCIHVIILDLAVYAIAFIPRIFFKVMNKLEGMDS